MEIKNYADTIDDILALLTANAETIGIDTANIHEAGGNRLDLDKPTPFLYVAAIPGEQNTLQGYGTMLDVSVFVAGASSYEAKTAIRDAMSYAEKVAKVLAGADLQTRADRPVEYVDTYADSAIVAVHFQTPFLFTEV